MANEPEWKDANPETENLPNKGRNIIIFIISGIALGVLTFVGSIIKPIGLAVGGFAFFSGFMMLMRRRKLNYKPGLILAACGFLLLLTHPRAGIVAGFAATLLIILAIGLVAFGIFKAIKLAWDLGKFTL